MAETRPKTSGDFDAAVHVRVRSAGTHARTPRPDRRVADTAPTRRVGLYATQICSLLHQRYADFTPQLLVQLQRGLAAPKTDKEDERTAWLARQRPLLRLLAELYIVRVITEPVPVIQAVKEAVRVLLPLLTLLSPALERMD